MIRKITIVLSLIILGMTTYVHADLRTLIGVGKSQAVIQKALKKETKAYNKVKEAIIAGKLVEGMESGDIRKKYGEPIIDNVYDKKRNAYKWLYMPATSSHFEGEKLYLFINEESKLVGWKLVE